MGLPIKSLSEVRAEIAKIKERIGLRKKKIEDDEDRLRIFEKLEKDLSSSHPPPVLAITSVAEPDEGPSTGLLLPAVSTPTATSSSSSDGIEITYTPTPSPPSDQDDMDYEPQGEGPYTAE